MKFYENKHVPQKLFLIIFHFLKDQLFYPNSDLVTLLPLLGSEEGQPHMDSFSSPVPWDVKGSKLWIDARWFWNSDMLGFCIGIFVPVHWI